MNGLNFQASVSNLTQMDRFQQGTHRMPVVNQEQNAQLARDEAVRKATVPVQPEEVEGKKIDPGQRRRDEAGKKRNRKSEVKKTTAPREKNNDGFIDIRI